MNTESPGPVRVHGLVFDVAGASGQGPRPENQDAFSVSAFPSTGILAVADGMGGQRAGRVAADTALQAVLRVGRVQSLDAARYAVRSADEAVSHAAGADPQDRQGMGCALAVMALSPDRGGELGWVAASVGDVRILSRSPDGTVRLETRDHTPAYARWEAGEIAFDEIPDSPGANRLQRAVGHGGEADTTWIPVKAGWTYLIHSDGVTKTMRLDELGQAMALPGAAQAVEAVVAKVEERGPDDNFTAVVVRVLGDDGTSTQESPTLAAPPRPYTAVPHQDSTVDQRPSRAPFNPPDDVTPNRRSPLAGVAALLSVLALALAGYAAFAASRGSSAGMEAARAEIAALRGSVDSLRARIPPDTTGRLPVSAADSGIMVVPPPAPPAAAPVVTPPAAPPAGQPRRP